MSTYQAASGAGQEGMDELFSGCKDVSHDFFFSRPHGTRTVRGVVCVKHVEVNAAASDEGVCVTQVPS
jgi:aspartate-semialdehyde dehydrogenase